MRILPLSLILVALITGCSGKSVRTFNDQGLDDQELATVSTYDENGLFGSSILLKSVDGESVRGAFDKAVETVKVTPGRHTYEVKFNDYGSLLGSVQILITFEFDAVAGHEYFVHIVVGKTVAQRVTFGGDLAGWIEDRTTGEKLSMIVLNTK